MQGGLAKGTWAGYEGDWKRYFAFCQRFSFPPLPPDPTVLVLFLAQLQTDGLAFKTITRICSGLAFWFRDSGFEFPRDNLLMDLMLKGIKKQARPVVKKEAIRLEHLRVINRVVERSRAADMRNWTILLCSFFGLLRISEVLRLKWEDVNWQAAGVWLRILPSKKQASIEFIPLVRNRDPSICPVRQLFEWYEVCRKCGKILLSDGVFCYANIHGVTSAKTVGTAQGRQVCAELIARAGFPAERLITHGARRGGYQLCEQMLVQDSDAQHLGRWMHMETTREYSGGHLMARLRAAKRIAGWVAA